MLKVEKLIDEETETNALQTIWVNPMLLRSATPALASAAHPILGSESLRPYRHTACTERSAAACRSTPSDEPDCQHARRQPLRSPRCHAVAVGDLRAVPASRTHGARAMDYPVGY
jgi:hypothetical protein